jgi:hypothetical protein
MWTADLRGSKASLPESPPPPAPTAVPVAVEEPWVTGTQPGAQRVPGIDEAPETKYVDPSVPNRRRPVLIGVGIGLVATAVVAAIVFGSQSDDGPSADAKAGPATALTRPADVNEADGTATTTTTVPATPSTTVAAATPATSPTTAAPAAPAAAPPTPRATANPALPLYTDQALPRGLTGSIGTCAWQGANGGQLLASGTITSSPTTNKSWTLTMHFLQARRELAQSSVAVPIGAGQTKPWTITTRMPNPPPDLVCSLSAS